MLCTGRCGCNWKACHDEEGDVAESGGEGIWALQPGVASASGTEGYCGGYCDADSARGSNSKKERPLHVWRSMFWRCSASSHCRAERLELVGKPRLFALRSSVVVQKGGAACGEGID